jgi:putative transposase
MVAKQDPQEETGSDAAEHPEEIIDQFVSGAMTAEAVNTASMAFKKALIETPWTLSSATTWATRLAQFN